MAPLWGVVVSDVPHREIVLKTIRHPLSRPDPTQQEVSPGVASNFERMVRIADATGIPLDACMQALSQEIRDALDLERFTVHKEMA